MKHHALVLAVLAAACSSSDDPTFGNSATATGGQVCSPGQQIACSCASGEQGAQACKADGTAFEQCVCDGAGGSGQGGRGGGAGSGGGQAGSGGTACEPGATEPCYGGPAGTRGVGLCVAGTATCDARGAGFGPCVGEVTPAAETCATPGDDDCDGQTNEEGPDCACVPGSQAACYSGPPATEGVGPCVGGSQVCDADGTGYGPCAGEITPQPETCNTPDDEDCDGQTNEEGAGCACVPSSTASCYDGPAGTENVGPCKGGTKTCNSIGTSYGPCVGQVLPSLDGCATVADEDCNGSPVPCDGNTTWSKSAGGDFGAAGLDVAVDGQGNVVVTGTFTTSIDWGGGALLGSANAEVFVAKLTSSGTHVFSKAFGSVAPPYGQTAHSIAVDTQGAVVLVGEVWGTIDFGGGTLASAGSGDVFVAKLDASGQHVWSKRFGDTEYDWALAVATDAVGDVYAIGGFTKTIDFGGGALIAMPANGVNSFLVKLAGPTGAHLWSKRLGPATTDAGIAVDPSGNVIFTGSTTGSIDLGGGPLPAVNGSDLYVAEYTPTGAYVWAKMFGSTGNDDARDLAVDALGNVVLGGDGSGGTTPDFGGGALAGTSFLVELDTNGTHVWSKAWGSGGATSLKGVAVDAAGNVLATGQFVANVDFGGGPVTSNGSADVFLAKFAPAGSLVWANHYGDAQLQTALGVATNAAGFPHVTGLYFGTIDFGNGPLQQAPSNAAFLAKLAP